MPSNANTMIFIWNMHFACMLDKYSQIAMYDRKPSIRWYQFCFGWLCIDLVSITLHYLARVVRCRWIAQNECCDWVSNAICSALLYQRLCFDKLTSVLRSYGSCEVYQLLFNYYLDLSIELSYICTLLSLLASSFHPTIIFASMPCKVSALSSSRFIFMEYFLNFG